MRTIVDLLFGPNSVCIGPKMHFCDIQPIDQRSFAYIDYTSHPSISEQRSRLVMDELIRTQCNFIARRAMTVSMRVTEYMNMLDPLIALNLLNHSSTILSILERAENFNKLGKPIAEMRKIYHECDLPHQVTVPLGFLIKTYEDGVDLANHYQTG